MKKLFIIKMAEKDEAESIRIEPTRRNFFAADLRFASRRGKGDQRKSNQRNACRKGDPRKGGYK